MEETLKEKTAPPFRIIVAEDEEGLQRLLVGYIQRAGFQAEGFAAGAKVIASLAKTPTGRLSIKTRSRSFSFIGSSCASAIAGLTPPGSHSSGRPWRSLQ